MKLRNPRIINVWSGRVLGVLVPALMLSINACTPELKIANNYMKSLSKTEIVVLAPACLFKSNLKTTPESDSLAIADSRFLKDIVDSTFISEYARAFAGELRSFGIRVNDTAMPYSAIDSTGAMVVVDLTQLILEEYLFAYRDSIELDTMVVYRDFNLNGVGLNVWIDLSGVDGSRKRFITLFDSYQVNDKVEGAFKINVLTGEVSYQYTLYEMQPVLVQSIPGNAARIHAGYLIDFLINEAIKAKMPVDGNTPILRMHYDRNMNVIRYDKAGEGFLLME